MKKPGISVLGILALCSLMGCATYSVQVNAYLDPKSPTQLTPGAAFFVIGNKDAQNPLLEKEVKEKSAKLLEARGYKITDFDHAEYYLLFSYGIGPGRGGSVAMPDYGFGFGVGPGYGRGNYFFAAPFFAYYPSSAERVYDRWLLLNVIDGKHYREKQEFRTVWVGETRSAGTSSDLREMINYLLTAAFQQFGQDTKKAVVVDLKPEDVQRQGLGK